MSATNTTEFLGLGQYVATDKPSFLGTYNSDMRSIDNFAKDISVRMGVVEEESGTAETDISNIQDDLEVITANVNQLIDKTGNIEQDETQIALNTSNINLINQGIANINDSIAEIINDIEYLDANAVKYGYIDTRYPDSSTIDVSGFESDHYKLYIFNFKGNNKKSCSVPFAYNADDFNADPVAVEDTTLEFYNESRPFANNVVAAIFRLNKSGDTVTVDPLSDNYGTVTHKRYDLTVNGSTVEPTEYSSQEVLTNVQFAYILVNVPGND